ncbi:MAG: tetratricopeptide (TPR) repeat protein [Colwellia sp.]|jgi:tetratricopeptide (TPR) repeat protein
MELTIEQAMQRAVEAHNQGELQEAERFYSMILQSQPTHPEANHNLGLIAVSVSKPEVALALFKIALDARPKIGQFWLSYIDALIKNNQMETAKAVIHQGQSTGLFGNKFDNLDKQLNADNISPPASQLNILLDHYNNGQYDNAETLAVLLTQQFPGHQFSWKVLGAIYGDTGRKPEALDANQKAIQLAPHDAEAHNNLGNALKELDRLDDAELSLRQAIALKLGYAEAHNNLSVILKELGRLDEAEVNIRQAITLKSDYAEAHNNLGITLKEQGKLDASEVSFRQAISLKSDNPAAHNNLGTTLRLMGRLDEAEVSLRQAIMLKPDFAPAMLNLSTVLNYMNNLDAAIHSYKKVLKIDADNLGLKAGVSLAILKFLEGDFAQSKKHLLAASKIKEKLSLQFKNEQIFYSYLLTILNWHEAQYNDRSSLISNKNIYVIGESHSLVNHWLQVQRSGRNFLGKALLIEGCMQWHLGNPVRNQYTIKLEKIINSLPKRSDILLAIGEIDCRLNNGIIKHNKKYPEKHLNEIVIATVENYLNYIFELNDSLDNNIVIQGVPCPNINITNIPEEEITELIEVIKMFNYELKSRSKEKGFGFLDLHKITNRGDGFSNSKWHTDAYHISPEGMQEAWRQYSS